MIYVLKLQEDKYYIGYTSQIKSRLENHFNNNGSAWTKKYKPIHLIEQFEGSKEEERLTTLKYMKEYGWQNVRGAAWTASNLSNPPLELRS